MIVIEVVKILARIMKPPGPSQVLLLITVRLR
jgi:hypothetical protein